MPPKFVPSWNLRMWPRFGNTVFADVISSDEVMLDWDGLSLQGLLSLEGEEQRHRDKAVWRQARPGWCSPGSDTLTTCFLLSSRPLSSWTALHLPLCRANGNLMLILIICVYRKTHLLALCFHKFLMMSSACSFTWSGLPRCLWSFISISILCEKQVCWSIQTHTSWISAKYLRGSYFWKTNSNL